MAEDVPPPPASDTPPPPPVLRDAPEEVVETPAEHVDTVVETLKKPHGKSPFAVAKQSTRRRALFTWGAVLVGVIFAIGLTTYLSSRGGILILDPQSDLIVTLNDRSFTAKNDPRGLLVHTRPGIYRLKITRPTFEAFIADVRVERGKTVKIRPVFSLIPSAAEGSGVGVDYVRTTPDFKEVFYLGSNRTAIYQLNVANQKQVPITSSPIIGVQDVQWSTNTEVALITLRDGVYLQEIPKYDFKTQSLVKVGGTDVKSPIWDPTNAERMAFIYEPSSGEKSLVFANKRITEIVRKADTGALTNPRLIWSPDARFIILIPRSTTQSSNDLWRYDTADGSLTQLTTSGSIVNASFSPDGKLLLYEASGIANNLRIVDVETNQQLPLTLSGSVTGTTWKDSATVFQANPTSRVLTEFGVSGGQKDLPFSFPSESQIAGMQYLPPSKTLVFYTSKSIYLSNLSL